MLPKRARNWHTWQTSTKLENNAGKVLPLFHFDVIRCHSLRRRNFSIWRIWLIIITSNWMPINQAKERWSSAQLSQVLYPGMEERESICPECTWNILLGSVSLPSRWLRFYLSFGAHYVLLTLSGSNNAQLLVNYMQIWRMNIWPPLCNIIPNSADFDFDN